MYPIESVPTVLAFRGEHCENVHFASTVVCSKTGNIKQMFPNSALKRFFLRSSAKPFQAYPLYQNQKAKDITLEEWAVICSSHASTPQQLRLVKQILNKSGFSEKDLKCGPHPPLSDDMAAVWNNIYGECSPPSQEPDENLAKNILCDNAQPSNLHNNCSGKHAGMLLACRLNNWPAQNYLDPEHPLQREISVIIHKYSETTNIDMAIDGCGAPVFCMPLENIARLFSNFVVRSEFKTIVKAMTTYPHLVGAEHRIDSQIMKITNGNLVAKVGAEGLIGIGNIKTGSGLAIRMHDGNNTVRNLLAIAVLKDLDWISSEQAQFLWSLPQFSRQRFNTQGKKVGNFEFNLAWY